MEKLPHYYFSWIVCLQKQRHICEMLPLETKLSGGKLLPHSYLGRGGGSRGNIEQQALQDATVVELPSMTAVIKCTH